MYVFLFQFRGLLWILQIVWFLQKKTKKYQLNYINITSEEEFTETLLCKKNVLCYYSRKVACIINLFLLFCVSKKISRGIVITTTSVLSLSELSALLSTAASLSACKHFNAAHNSYVSWRILLKIHTGRIPREKLPCRRPTTLPCFLVLIIVHCLIFTRITQYLHDGRC